MQETGEQLLSISREKDGGVKTFPVANHAFGEPDAKFSLGERESRVGLQSIQMNAHILCLLFFLALKLDVVINVEQSKNQEESLSVGSTNLSMFVLVSIHRFRT